MLPMSAWLSIYCWLSQDGSERGWPAIWPVRKHELKWLYKNNTHWLQISAFLGKQAQELKMVCRTLSKVSAPSHTHTLLFLWLSGSFPGNGPRHWLQSYFPNLNPNLSNFSYWFSPKINDLHYGDVRFVPIRKVSPHNVTVNRYRSPEHE